MNDSKSALRAYDPDLSNLPAVALRLDFAQYEAEVPVHSHRQAQLILALHGAVTCIAGGELWIVPPNCGVWIPPEVPHSNRATENAQLSYLFVAAPDSSLPRQCCILSISPLLREMIHRLATFPLPYPEQGPEARLVAVLLEELAQSPQESFGLPVTDHPKIAEITRVLLTDPADRSRIDEWACRLALSERSLTRLFLKETGLTFGRWRQQFHLLYALRELAGGASVQTVSLDLGYSSVTAFITMFKKAVGTTPSRFFVSAKPFD